MGFGVTANINEQPLIEPGCFEIVEDLGFVFRGNFFYRLDLDDDLIVANEIGFVGLLENFGFLGKPKFLLGNKRNPPLRQLLFQALQIHRLQKPAAHFFIDFKHGTRIA